MSQLDKKIVADSLSSCIKRLTQPEISCRSEQEFSSSLTNSSSQIHIAIDTLMSQVSAVCMEAIKRRTQLLHNEANEIYANQLGKVKEVKSWIEARDELLDMCHKFNVDTVPPENLTRAKGLAENFKKQAIHMERTMPAKTISLNDSNVGVQSQRLVDLIMNVGTVHAGSTMEDDFSDCISLGASSSYGFSPPKPVSIDFTQKSVKKHSFGMKGKSGPEFQKFNSPRGIAALPGGFIAVTDSYNNRVKIMDLINLKEFQCLTFNIERSKTISSKQLSFTGLAYDVMRNRLMISDAEKGSIFAVDVSKIGSASIAESGNQIHDWPIVATFGEHGFGPRQFNVPYGLCIDPNCEYLFICDSKNHQVKVWNLRTSEFVQSIGEYGKKLGQFCEPLYCSVMTVDPLKPNGGGMLLAVSDNGNARVQLFSIEELEGSHSLKVSPINNVGKEGSSLGTFSNPRGLVFEPSGGTFIVADAGNKRLQVFKKDGTPITAFASGMGIIPEALGLYHDSDDSTPPSICVSDRKNHVVHIF